MNNGIYSLPLPDTNQSKMDCYLTNFFMFCFLLVFIFTLELCSRQMCLCRFFDDYSAHRTAKRFHNILFSRERNVCILSYMKYSSYLNVRKYKTEKQNVSIYT